jgi:hypothetical protein
MLHCHSHSPAYYLSLNFIFSLFLSPLLVKLFYAFRARDFFSRAFAFALLSCCAPEVEDSSLVFQQIVFEDRSSNSIKLEIVLFESETTRAFQV